MEQWLPRQPLIITPLVPLVWTVSWLCIVTARFMCGVQYPQPARLQDSVLLVSAVVLLANIYNLILICQRIDEYQKEKIYSQNALLLAIILIISIVLAWGQPKIVLIPNHLNIWVVIFVVLNTMQALLGQYFVGLTRPRTRRRQSSLLLPVILFTLSGLVIVPCYFPDSQFHQVAVICGGLLLVAFAWSYWRNLPGLFSRVLARNSIIYQLMVGVNLITAVFVVILGINFLVLNWDSTSLPLLSYCFILSLISNGITGILISAMQRYNNDYRYGHTHGHYNRYIFCGMIIMVAFLILNSWLII